MTSERVEQQIGRLLDEAEAAVSSQDWDKVHQAANSALILNPESADARAFLDAAERGRASATPTVIASQKLLLSPARVLVFSVLSAGLYIFYWSYLTWKQLKTETREEHYPIWHALTLFVPFYGLFRVHNHLETILDQAERAGTSSLSPPAGVVMLIVANIASWISFGVTDVTGSVITQVVSTTLYTAIVLIPQLGLNKAWLHKYPGSQNAGVNPVEIALALFGILIWFGTFVPQ